MTGQIETDPELAARDLAARRAWAARELELQDGVISRAQLIWGGYTPNDLRRAIRRREMQLVHRGVYVTALRTPTSPKPAGPAPRNSGAGPDSLTQAQLQPEVEPQPSQT